jgi:hypothetical protein
MRAGIVPARVNDLPATRRFQRTGKTWGGARGERQLPAPLGAARASAALCARLGNLPVDQTELQFPHPLFSSA